MVLRQLPAAAARSVSVHSTCTSFAASANVVDDTSGPTTGPVPKAGGAPGGRSAGFWARLRNAAAAPSTPNGVAAKNCLRDFDMFPPNQALDASGAVGSQKSRLSPT